MSLALALQPTYTRPHPLSSIFDDLCELAKMVNSVELSSDAYLVCLMHALSTEKEEVMGLLLGEVF